MKARKRSRRNNKQKKEFNKRTFWRKVIKKIHIYKKEKKKKNEVEEKTSKERI